MTIELEQREPDSDIERQLAAMTRWDEPVPEPALASEALRRVRAGNGGQSAKRNLFSMNIGPARWWILGSSLAAGLVFGAFLWPESPAARKYSTGDVLASAPPHDSWNDRQFTMVDDNVDSGSSMSQGPAIDGKELRLYPGRELPSPFPWQGEGPQDIRRQWRMTSADADLMRQGASQTPAADRRVVHKATMELESKDVRSTFLKATHIVSAAKGEFIEASAMTGEDERALANLTMRVRADRLSEVMTALRDLGAVINEQINGEDVTTQAVDLDARLRNEQRIEKELLELVESREDAPLEDILRLREQLNRVREQIERLAAQREQLSRLVSLATVLVIIHAENKPIEEEPEPEKPTIGAYFGDSISGAWSAALRTIADGAAFLVQVLVGGVIWWALAATAIVGAVRLHRRSGYAKLSEA